MEHWLDVEKFVGNFGYEQLSDNDNSNYGPKFAAHFYGEHAVAGFEAARVEHVPEVSPHEDAKKEGGFVGCHW